MGIKICELCSKRNAKYVCQECSRAICERCLEPYTWLCLECYRKIGGTLSQEPESEEKTLFQIPFIKIFLMGFILMFIGIIVIILATLVLGLKNSFSLIFLIGPIPIIFGGGEYSIPLIILATVLTVICIIIFILYSKRGIRL
ncbi:MAG: DUF131 domain-containing protein [Candidatus Bathyarchaeia archaeon]